MNGFFLYCFYSLLSFTWDFHFLIRYGVGIVPEGLIEFIPEVGRLIAEISEVVAEVGGVESFDAAKLSAASAAVFTFLPAQFQKQLLLDRDSHGNVNVSGIETEKLLSLCVEQELARRAAAGDAVAAAAAQTYTAAFHFFGYEGRSALPSQFDCDYCYALGFNAGLLLSRGFTGMISSVGDLDKPAAEWSCGGMPHTNMMNVERRSGGDKCVIKKALTELEGLPFLTFARSRDRWAVSDCYRSPGPMQFQGPSASRISITLQKEYEQKRGAALAPIKSLASLRARDPTPLSTLPQANDFGGLKPSADVKPIAVVVAGSSVPGINNTIAALAAWHRGQVNAATVAFVGGVASLVAETPSLKELSAEELHEMANSGGCDIMGCGGIGDDLAAMLGDDAKAAAAARNMAPYAALVLIGGIAALNAASVLAALKTGVPVIVLPASIANDVGCNVDISLGFDSASRTASQVSENTKRGDGARCPPYPISPTTCVPVQRPGARSSCFTARQCTHTHATVSIGTRREPWRYIDTTTAGGIQGTVRARNAIMAAPCDILPSILPPSPLSNPLMIILRWITLK